MRPLSHIFGMCSFHLTETVDSFPMVGILIFIAILIAIVPEIVIVIVIAIVIGFAYRGVYFGNLRPVKASMRGSPGSPLVSSARNANSGFHF